VNKNLKEKIVLTFSILLSFLISTILWRLINFPFQDPEIIGNYSLNNHDHKNDVTRYIVFVILPLLTFIIVKFFFNKNFFTQISFFFKNDQNVNRSENSTYLASLFIIFLFLLFNFLSLEFPIQKIDTFHEGQTLSSAYKSLIDNSLWSGSYVTVGIFYETLSSKFIWQIFDNVSIGLARYTELIYIFLFKILLVYFSFSLTYFLKISTFNKNIFFIVNSLILLNLIDYNKDSVDLLSYREIPIIFLLILFIFLVRKVQLNLILFSIASLSILSLMWGVDRGLICNLLIITIILFLLIKNDYRSGVKLVFFVIFFWLSLYFILGHEFNFFINNTISVYKEMSYVHGFVHPIPFTNEPNSARATKTILLITFCLLVSINLIFRSNTNFSNSFKHVILFIALICFGSYLYALGRSDGGHIKGTLGFPLIFISIYFSYSFIFKFSEFFDNLKDKSKNILLFFIVPIFLFSFISFNINNILNYKDRFKLYSNLKDSFFLSQDESKLVDMIKPTIQNKDCIQLFSNDVAFYYLLKKKSCTKFYLAWSVSPLNKQQKLINELGETEIIISGGPKDWWDVPLSQKLFLITEFVNKNYYKQEKIIHWDIFLKNK
jgi:hypothetical protein